ncbi:MAG: alpha/beta hydrolase [Chloracidobacterium sp.]|nr:alpha/beta hydrolase [Chloracidobacterium sp.]
MLIGLGLTATPSQQENGQSIRPQPRMISIGERRLAVYCEGKATRSPTVILIPAPGRTAQDWKKVQPAVAKFARACSYDHANFGASDRADAYPQPMEEAIDDLQAWLKASGEKNPFIFVGHSGSGIYTRRFGAKYPGQMAGLVFVDSAHEEQALRLHELDPQGPRPDDLLARIGLYIEPGARLQWRTDLPLIVLGRGKPTPRRARDGSDSQTNRMTEEQFAEWDRIWRGFQEDLARRSSHGELRVAEESGHFIQWDQPEMVIQAIRDVMRSPVLADGKSKR